jgi:hypothetical protein
MVRLLVVVSFLWLLVLSCGCQDKYNQPVKDGKTVYSDRATMEKMYQGRR